MLSSQMKNWWWLIENEQYMQDHDVLIVLQLISVGTGIHCHSNTCLQCGNAF